MVQAIPQQPFQSSRTWVGDELATSDEWIRHFSEAEIAQLEQASTQAMRLGLAPTELLPSHFDMPLVKRACDAWLEELNFGRGFILLRGLPVERWGRELSEIAYLGLGLQMGTLSPQNIAGDLLGRIRDTGEDPDDPSVRLYKTRRAQGFHTDGADVIGLLCLQTARAGGQSRIVSSVSVFNYALEHRPDLVPLMFEPFHFDRNNEQGEGEPPTFAIPLVYVEGDSLRMFYIGWYIRDAQRHAEVPRLTASQIELLDLIDTAADKLALDMDFQPGDIQLLKNATILHARAAFEDWDDPARKRHLLRLWINSQVVAETNIVKAVPVREGHRGDDDFLDS